MHDSKYFSHHVPSSITFTKKKQKQQNKAKKQPELKATAMW